MQAARHRLGKEVKPCSDTAVTTNTMIRCSHVIQNRNSKIFMTKPVRNDGIWTMYKDIVQQSKELEEDVRTLHRMHVATLDYYEEMSERYCELPGWHYLHAQMSMTLPMLHEILPAVIPTSKEHPDATQRARRDTQL